MIISELKDGGFLSHDIHFIPKPMADKLFEYIKNNVIWKQEITSYGTPFPRLAAYFADKGLSYTYSGVTHIGEGWNKALEILKEKVDKASGTVFNSLLINYYRDGKDSIGWHSDAEPELGENPVVASITLGATRDFELKHKKGAKVGRKTIPLANGSLLVMSGTIQHHWVHAVLKTPVEVGPRINLTFRKINATM